MICTEVCTNNIPIRQPYTCCLFDQATKPTVITRMSGNEFEVDGNKKFKSLNERIPADLCGLDFTFHTFNKMYIQDIINLEACNVIPGMYWYKKHPIYKVDIIGIVVKRQENVKCFVYGVDDGTGVITCCCWKNRMKNQSPEEMEHLIKGGSKLPKVLKEKVSAIMMSQSKMNEGYSLGDLVHIRGKIRIFREVREVMASYHNKLEDPNMELVRMAELPGLYRTSYDVDTLPKKVLEEITEMSQGNNVKRCQREVVPELKRLLLTYLEEHQPDEINIKYISSLPQVTELLEKDGLSIERETALQKALGNLEEEGWIFTKENHLVYEVIKPDCPLENLIMDILKRDCVKEKYQDEGCQFMHIVKEVRNTQKYSAVQNTCILTCLNNLEYRSDLIRTSFYKYILCTV
ncbi:CST complex subunit STN1-like isoform X1 [Saccostrea cucullata]|uniref:CST complex subunit STN1-like isoform X1 n=2 Tax=Saccostrea cuccullata TaxID=36930 RepID=UPI002ED412D6